MHDLYTCPVCSWAVRALQEVGAPWQPATDECSDCHTHAFVTAPDAPVNPILYWVGHREGDSFDIDQAKGPYRYLPTPAVVPAVHSIACAREALISPMQTLSVHCLNDLRHSNPG